MSGLYSLINFVFTIFVQEYFLNNLFKILLFNDGYAEMRELA